MVSNATKLSEPKRKSADEPGGRAEALGPTAEGVRRRLILEVTEGSIRLGERLGAERELAARYKVSRSALRAALDLLESEGMIRRVRGRAGGVFVADSKVERDLSSLTSLPTYLRRQGFASGARVLATSTIEADAETAAAFQIEPGVPVTEIVRVRLADDEPISLERAMFPAERFPGLLDLPLGGSLYELLEVEYGLRIGEADERIEIVSATPREMRALGVRRSEPLVSIMRTAFDADGRPFERSHDLFRGDRIRIIVRSRSDPSEGSNGAQSSVKVVMTGR